VIVALDAEAFNALAGPASVRKQRVRRVLRDRADRSVTLVEAPLHRLHDQFVAR